MDRQASSEAHSYLSQVGSEGLGREGARGLRARK